MSLKKAHLLNWSVQSKNGRATLLRMLTDGRELTDVPVRIDPAMNRALDFARAENLIRVESKTTGCVLSLTTAGTAFANEIIQSNCLKIEAAFFNQLRGSLPEPKVKELLEWETSL